MTATRTTQENERAHGASYGRFAAMVGTSMAVMFGLMYVNTYALDHVRWSETRFFMMFVMGASMAIIMLSFMLGMYRNRRINTAIFVGSAVVLIGAIWLIRSQETVQESSYMRAMIPHHSIAILTSERSEIDDIRVCGLAVEIIEAQRREIAQMSWLIKDIAENGSALTREEAERRPIPEFTGITTRTCADR